MASNFVFVLVVAIFVYLAPVPVSLAQPAGTVESGTIWYDTDGNEIHAHGGQIWTDLSTTPPTFYWHGTSQKLGASSLSEGINVYTSTDLTTWTFRGMVFKNTSIENAGADGPYRIERPKVLYNAATKLFVMWFHLDTASFSLQKVGVCTSSSPLGPFSWVAGFQPDGLPSYDMGMAQDENGNAFLVRSVRNQFAGISQLTSDYLNTTGIVSSGPQIEGQCLFKYQGIWYLLGSHLTGWAPNPAVLSYTTSPTLNGAQWISLGNPSNDSTTFNSQSTFVYPVVGSDSRMFLLYMGDRWNADGPGGVSNATYVWLPLLPVFDDSPNLYMPYHASWRIQDYLID